MWVLMLSLSVLAQGVEIAVSKPGVVRLSAVDGAVFVPACRGVTWAVFSAESGRFEPTAPPACGPSQPALRIEQKGVDFELDVPLGPLPDVGFHILQPTVVYAEKCRDKLPFYLSECGPLKAVKGPQMVVRSRGQAVLVEPTEGK